MALQIDNYPNSLQNLRTAFARAYNAFPGSPINDLALRLINGAIQFDMRRAADLGVNWKYEGIARDPDRPPEYEHVSIIGVDWADDPASPLQPGEAWNTGRRATLTGTLYGLDAKGRPVNPYMNTGTNGRGALGLMGVNHAVDNGTVVIRPDDKGGHEVCFSLGITRKYDNDAPAFSGGFAKYRQVNGVYQFDEEAQLETQVEEFFEEMVSGSIVLRPEFAHRIGSRYESIYNTIKAKRGGQELSGDQSGEILEQIITGLRMEQVEKYDPGFLIRLRDHFRQATTCFAGPVLCDNRNTNTAWIESSLAWVPFNDDIWNRIKGPNPAFDYRLSGGDDASGVVYHRFEPALIENAYASHGAMMCFMAASFLLYAQENNIALAPAVLRQMEDVAQFLETYRTPRPGTTPPDLAP